MIHLFYKSVLTLCEYLTKLKWAECFLNMKIYEQNQALLIKIEMDLCDSVVS